LIFVAGALFGAFVFHALTKAPGEPSLAPVLEIPRPPPAITSPRAEAPAVAGSAPSAVPAAQPASRAPAPAALVASAVADQPRNDALLVPVVGVKPLQLSDTFNDKRGMGRHEALDIPAPRGTPVIAVEDGRIAKLFRSIPGGLTIYHFDPSEKYAYYYAHLDGYAAGVAEGKQLKRGEVIGYVGSTGNANEANPHLHFAIFELGPEKRWWKGTAINPFPLLTGR
jgi:murein DD-endopeptidase MepM/ murein hydrolase activator NlpD